MTDRNLELGVIGNCAIAALVDPSGTIVWSCFPRLDGDPVFCADAVADPITGPRSFAVGAPQRIGRRKGAPAPGWDVKRMWPMRFSDMYLFSPALNGAFVS